MINSSMYCICKQEEYCICHKKGSAYNSEQYQMNRFLRRKLKDFLSYSIGWMDSLLIRYVFYCIFFSNYQLYSIFVRRTLFSWNRSSSYVQISSFNQYLRRCFCNILSYRSFSIDLSEENSIYGKIRDVNSKLDMLEIMLSWSAQVALVQVVYNLQFVCGNDDDQMETSSMDVGRDRMCSMSPSTSSALAFADMFFMSIYCSDCLSQRGDFI